MRDTAIRNLYPLVVCIAEDNIATDKDGEVITIDESLIEVEITRLKVELPKEVFKTNRQLILDSISWIHERIQSQTVLIQGGEALTASYTVAQSTEYYRFKQALRDKPSITSDWSSISYPTVPQHVYDDMTDNIKLLCQELLCNPVV